MLRAFSAAALAAVNSKHSASSRAAGTEARWRGCLVAFDAIDPVAASAFPLEEGSAGSFKGSTHVVVDAAAGGSAGGEGSPEAVVGIEMRKDDHTTAFLTRQLRLLMERSSEQAGEVLNCSALHLFRTCIPCILPS